MDFREEQTIIETPIGGGLCPLGYAAGVDDLVVSLMQTWEDAVLLDIRLSARSRWYPHWNKSALQARWGSRYVHERRLGNVHYRSAARPLLLDPEAVFPWMIGHLQQNHVLLLVCACKEYDRCHRKMVVESLLCRCQDSLRTEGMRFDVGRGCYAGLLSDGDHQVCVSPHVFEQHRWLVPDPYDVEMWEEAAYEFPEQATVEVVGEGS